MKNCIGKKKICMHSIFKLEIQAVQSLDYYPNAKQKRKIPHQKISMLLSYFPCMSTGSSYILLKECTLLSVTIKVCFVFTTSTENDSEWLRRCFYWFVLKKKKATFYFWYFASTTKPLHAAVELYKLPIAFSFKLDSILLFFKHTYYFSLYISNTFHIWILAWLPEFHWRHSILATSHLQWPAIFLLQEGSL